MKISRIFGLELQQPQLDFVDVDADHDTPLFLDPFAFAQREDTWSIDCHNLIVSFFQSAVDYIRAGDHDRARGILNSLSEPNETCLGLSRGTPQGRGVSGKQALDVYDKLAESEAVRTGFLSELSDCELLIEGIGPDKISDITTNIVRGKLIEYTQEQCRLHGIALGGDVASGRLWDPHERNWSQQYVQLPIVGGRKILLVPKASVRWSIAIDHQEYYQHFVLNFLQHEHLDQSTALVHTLKSGERRVYKKDLKEQYPLSKDFLYRFSRENPEVLARYKGSKRVGRSISNEELAEDFDERTFAQLLREELGQIPTGSDSATRYHHFMIGVLEFVFYPNLIYPKKEREIHEGRKRIDIVYTNAAIDGAFYRAHTAHNITSNEIMVECKNYTSDPANPELDQISGRFSANRGWLGLLLARRFDNKDRFMERCRDTARDQRGFILPIADEDIARMLTLIEEGRRSGIDVELERVLQFLRS